MALAAACVCAFRKVALWVHATVHPLLLRRTPFPSEPLRFFSLLFSIFSPKKIPFSFRGFVSPTTLDIYLFIYLLYSIPVIKNCSNMFLANPLPQ
jgi:hypothetical protein